MPSDLSFNDYLNAGGWRAYAQKVARDAFVAEARSWLEPLQQMRDAEQARLRALENTIANNFLLVIAIKHSWAHLY